MKHWTSRSVEDFQFRLAADFIAQLEAKMEQLDMSQAELARAMDVTEGRISQIVNSPGNLSLNLMVKCARVLGMKLSVVAYEDEDKENNQGPVDAEIFRRCWEKAGYPRDFWALEESQQERHNEKPQARAASTGQAEIPLRESPQVVISLDKAAMRENDAASNSAYVERFELMGGAGEVLTASNSIDDELISNVAH